MPVPSAPASAPSAGWEYADAPAAEVEPKPSRGSLLDQVLDRTAPLASRRDGQSGLALDRLAAFRRAADAGRERDAAVAWFGTGILQATLPDYETALARDIARIERLVADQVAAVLHQPQFQALEASWRSLHWLVAPLPSAAETDLGGEPAVEVRVLNADKGEVARSFRRARSLEQSPLYRTIYENGLVQAGADPIGLLVGDYAFDASRPDVQTLRSLSQIAAISFAPLVAAAAPELLGFESFAALDRRHDLDGTFGGPEYAAWRSFCDQEEARFVGLVAPRVLMRRPYEDDGATDFGFRFREPVEAGDRPDADDAAGDWLVGLDTTSDEAGLDASRYLWANAAYAVASVAIRSYRRTGWFGDVRGRSESGRGGGTIDRLPTAAFGSEAGLLARRPSTEIALGRYWEETLAAAGLVPVVDLQDASGAVIPALPSVHRRDGVSYGTDEAKANADLSSGLQHILCAARFAHYLQTIARDKIGGTQSAEELESELNGQWLMRYVSDSDLPDEQAVRLPLRDGRVELEPVPGEAGSYRMTIFLKPQYQLDALESSLRFDRELLT